MYKFPGEEEGIYLIIKDGIPLHKEPLPKVGSVATCKVLKSTPSIAFLTIVQIDGIKTNIPYKAQLKLQDLQATIDDSTFVDNFYVKNDMFDALIIGFGDHNGICVSTISKDFGIIIKNEIL